MNEQYECLWYNGETASYELLDFNPNVNLDKKEILKKAKEILVKKYNFSKEELEKVAETIYLIDIGNLIKLK